MLSVRRNACISHRKGGDESEHLLRRLVFKSVLWLGMIVGGHCSHIFVSLETELPELEEYVDRVAAAAVQITPSTCNCLTGFLWTLSQCKPTPVPSGRIRQK